MLRSMGSNINLTDYKGELLALRFIDTQDITSTPKWADGEEVTQKGVVRAEVVQVKIGEDKSITASRIGRSLVFQKAIANDLLGTRDWAFGRFDEFERPTASAPDATMYELVPQDELLESVVAAFEAAGIDL